VRQNKKAHYHQLFKKPLMPRRKKAEMMTKKSRTKTLLILETKKQSPLRTMITQLITKRKRTRRKTSEPYLEEF
jgi:hypothetical protein